MATTLNIAASEIVEEAETWLDATLAEALYGIARCQTGGQQQWRTGDRVRARGS